jgi:hypothetical protein
MYLDILVDITLHFITLESPQGPGKAKGVSVSSETLTVNASACEFMELLLKQVEKYGQISNKMAHKIINPLIDTFHMAVVNKNYAMQVNIINLLNLILNECNFLGNQGEERNNKSLVEESKVKCAKTLRNSQLMEGIILGLKSDVSFVRQKLIKFVEMLVPFLKKFAKDNENFKADFQVQIEKLIDCFCELLKKVDVSFFSSA